MSTRTFQTCLAKLVIRPEYQRLIADEGESALPSDLTPREKGRLLAVARQAGMELSQTMYRGFRLSKALSMLPAVCRTLGDELLVSELNLFWDTTMPYSLYYIDEAHCLLRFFEERVKGGDLSVTGIEEALASDALHVEANARKFDPHLGQMN